MVKCYKCKNEENPFVYLSLRLLTDDSETIESLDFCCSDCLSGFLSRPDKEKTHFFLTREHTYLAVYRVDRCSGYYDCEKLSIIHKRCERATEISLTSDTGNNGYRATGHTIPPVLFCDPGDVAMIKASLKLFGVLERFESTSVSDNNALLPNSQLTRRLNAEILEKTKRTMELNNEMLNLGKLSSEINKEVLDNIKRSSELNEETSKLNREMLEHIKNMKTLTLIMLIVAAVAFVVSILSLGVSGANLIFAFQGTGSANEAGVIPDASVNSINNSTANTTSLTPILIDTQTIILNVSYNNASSPVPG